MLSPEACSAFWAWMCRSLNEIKQIISSQVNCVRTIGLGGMQTAYKTIPGTMGLPGLDRSEPAGMQAEQVICSLQDGDFQEERFRNIVNAYLANTLGNLVNRCLGLLKKNCDSTFPADAASLGAEHPLRAATAAEVSYAVPSRQVPLHYSLHLPLLGHDSAPPLRAAHE